MKNTTILFCFLVFSITISAQSKEVNTFTDFEMAKQYAADNEKNILMVFAGSDWCKPCIQFKKEILSSPIFQQWGEENLAILYLDFPSRRKNKLSKKQTAHNEALAEGYNKSGAFPNIVLLNLNEKILGNPSFKNQSPEQFIEELEHFVGDGRVRE